MLFMALNQEGKAFLLGDFSSIDKAKEDVLAYGEEKYYGLLLTDVMIVGLPEGLQIKVQREEYLERQRELSAERDAKYEEEMRRTKEAKDRVEYERLKAKFEKS